MFHITISGKVSFNLKKRLYIVASFLLNVVVTEDTYLKNMHFLFIFLVFPMRQDKKYNDYS